MCFPTFSHISTQTPNSPTRTLRTKTNHLHHRTTSINHDKDKDKEGDHHYQGDGVDIQGASACTAHSAALIGSASNNLGQKASKLRSSNLSQCTEGLVAIGTA
jgi:hypothetical protein